MAKYNGSAFGPVDAGKRLRGYQYSRLDDDHTTARVSVGHLKDTVDLIQSSTLSDQ